MALYLSMDTIIILFSFAPLCVRGRFGQKAGVVSLGWNQSLVNVWRAMDPQAAIDLLEPTNGTTNLFCVFAIAKLCTLTCPLRL